MKRQKCFGVLSLVIGIVMLLGCGARVLLAEQKNKPVKSGFSAAELDPGRTDAQKLAQKLPLEQVDVPSYARYAARAFAAVGYGQPVTYTLHTTLRYYAAPGDRTPALTLEAGTAVQMVPLDCGGSYKPLSHFYGAGCSFPAYQYGWRYTRAFQTETVKQSGEDSLPFYYIRTEDLLREAQAAFDEQAAQLGIEGEERQANWEAELQNGFFLMDNKLYEHGICLSPDLLEPLWDGWNTALLAAGIAFCLAGLALLFCAGRRDGQTGG